MSLKNINVLNFRNLSQASLNFSKVNSFYGLNGSGKTSLLESIYYLSNIKSFRTAAAENLIAENSNKFELFGTLNDNDCLIKKTKDKVHLSINGEVKNKSYDIVSLSPTIIFHNRSIDLVCGSPKIRRQFLDKICFYLYPNYYKAYLNFIKSLKNRNIILSTPYFDKLQFQYWNEKYIEYFEIINRLRIKIIDGLNEEIQKIISKYSLEKYDINLTYTSGVPKESTIAEVLKNSLDRDKLYKTTLIGPHRSNIIIKIKEKLVERFYSRGQIKTAVIILLLAQSNIIIKKSIFIVDDFDSELDNDNKNLLAEMLFNTKNQLFFTGIEKKYLPRPPNKLQNFVFKVEAGMFFKDY